MLKGMKLYKELWDGDARMSQFPKTAKLQRMIQNSATAIVLWMILGQYNIDQVLSKENKSPSIVESSTHKRRATAEIIGLK